MSLKVWIFILSLITLSSSKVLTGLFDFTKTSYSKYTPSGNIPGLSKLQYKEKLEFLDIGVRMEGTAKESLLTAIIPAPALSGIKKAAIMTELYFEKIVQTNTYSFLFFINAISTGIGAVGCDPKKNTIYFKYSYKTSQERYTAEKEHVNTNIQCPLAKWFKVGISVEESLPGKVSAEFAFKLEGQHKWTVVKDSHDGYLAISANSFRIGSIAGIFNNYKISLADNPQELSVTDLEEKGNAACMGDSYTVGSSEVGCMECGPGYNLKEISHRIGKCVKADL